MADDESREINLLRNVVKARNRGQDAVASVTKKDEKAALVADSNTERLQDQGDTNVSSTQHAMIPRQSRGDSQQGNEESEDFDILQVVQKRAALIASEEAAEGNNNTQEQARQEQPRNVPESVPGAYSGAPGESLHRLEHVRFSLLCAPEAIYENKEPLVTLPHQHEVETGTPTGRRLTQAVMISETSGPKMEAEPFDTDAFEIRKAHDKKKRKLYIVLLTIVGLSAFATAIGLLVSNRDDKQTGTQTLTPPSTAPTVAPSVAPTASPSHPLDLLLQDLPEYTLESLKKSSTPQWEAFVWLSNHPNITMLEEWRKKQLFALATFFYAMEGPHWPEHIQERWLVYHEHECHEWFSSEFGDMVEDGQWIESDFYGLPPCNEQEEFDYLVLAQLNLTGLQPSIPPEITLLTSLSILFLTVNNFQVPLTDFLPSQIYQMSNLRELNLEINQLSGTLPTELGLMSQLTYLSLYSNALTGNLPSQFGLANNLPWLNLMYNSLSGPIPTQLGLMTGLELLRLEHNALSGPIPSELGTMTNTRVLYLDENQLSHSIPTQLGLLTHMKYMTLHDNLLNSSIPSQLGQMTNVELLLMERNAFLGSLPTQLGRMTSMKQLALEDNKLVGSLPTELGLMSSLQRMWWNDNEFSGVIPSELGMTNATLVYLQNNRLSSVIPSQLGLLSGLTEMLLQSNQLSGQVPLELDGLVLNGSLELLHLEDNQLSGTIESGLCQLGEYNASFEAGFAYDCDQLCGCDWCACL